MNDNQKKFMKLLFNEGETVCVSHNKFAFHSIAQDELFNDKVLLISNNEKAKPHSVLFEDINLVSVNPVAGYRNDANCTAYRSFLIEVDNMDLSIQRQYIEEEIKLPFSSCIFSGNKSYHYVVSLDEPLPNIEMYNFFAQWILNICSHADQQTKNPSRATRFPDNIRNDGRNQDVVHIGSRISQEELFRWLYQWEVRKPIQRSRPLENFSRHFHNTVPPWVQEDLKNEITTNRNTTWFKHACSCFKNGWSLEDLIIELEPHFQPEFDFTKKEWLGVLKSAYKKTNRDVGESNEK